jgi:hypothetical protein
MATVRIVNVVATEPQRGWCDRCLTSAVLTFDVVAVDSTSGLPGVVLGTVSGCTRCDPRVFGEA